MAERQDLEHLIEPRSKIQERINQKETNKLNDMSWAPQRHFKCQL